MTANPYGLPPAIVRGRFVGPAGGEPGAPTIGAAPAPVGQTLDCIKLLRACPHRDTSEGGCAQAGCARGKGDKPGLVYFADCLACVRAGGPPPYVVGLSALTTLPAASNQSVEPTG